ncbi:NAD-dependent epimerase/dehydratase family protein [Novosphingobium profundi]|uniref:NAD-dependent epimerase/dehydratase family protein n=1 Tax=Novosphingobium profundi TaxID=1774954 RepID=UPI001BDABDEC|nr:NAD-dependent epimerase/dehydratase family protein [Novosphingobium profundi]MBT0670614.1 NAD-dependent epimerase/dehydratase family protein [Novosphingobium profundi]
MNREIEKPVVVVTGASGNLGRSLSQALAQRYTVVGLDKVAQTGPVPVLEIDLTASRSVDAALADLRRTYGSKIAAVIHLIGYFDFSGDPDPLYDAINVEGTRRLLAGLADFAIERFIYASTMLVHAPTRPGERIDETAPLGPRWVYPQSKLAAETVIRNHASMPVAILRLAGVYDSAQAVPTLAHQIARIYERRLDSHLYSGTRSAGQAMLHREDMLDAITRAVARRTDLPGQTTLLIGEPEAVAYQRLQDILGRCLHGEAGWETVRIPKPLARFGATIQDRLEPVIPDAIDKGAAPFIRPFMVEMADDSYALDISRAQDLLDWRPTHRLEDELPAMIANLTADPAAWYDRNGIDRPEWLARPMSEDTPAVLSPQAVERHTHAQRHQWRWTHFVNALLGVLLLSQPPAIGLSDTAHVVSEGVLGAGLCAASLWALGSKRPWARLLAGGLGLIIMALPMLFVTPNAADYTADTLIGALAFALALGPPPEIGPSPAARGPLPQVPPGWSFNPSSWVQRLPVIVLALFGFLISRTLAAYQMGHTAHVWDPFFAGSAADPRNGTEEIITSWVSRAWPVPDAALGAYTYLLEILTGIVGSRARWRTMPWLVILFGLMIVPLGLVSITFIIIQPIVLGTWSTLALAGAAAMLLQIPYSLDELVASLAFIRRRMKRGDNALTVLLFGGPDEGAIATRPAHEFERPARHVLHAMWSGAVNLPWTLSLAGVIGVSLMFTRLTLGATGSMANVDHVLGALVLTVLSVAAAEVTRLARVALVPIGIAVMVSPWLCAGGGIHGAVSLGCGGALIALSLARGRITERYGAFERFIR